jgi:hypothetical protein
VEFNQKSGDRWTAARTVGRVLCRHPREIRGCHVSFSRKKKGYCICSGKVAVASLKYWWLWKTTCKHRCLYSHHSEAITIPDRSSCPAGVLLTTNMHDVHPFNLTLADMDAACCDSSDCCLQRIVYVFLQQRKSTETTTSKKNKFQIFQDM